MLKDKNIKIKVKSRIWWLTIFANPNVNTTIYPIIYVQHNFYSLNNHKKESIILHEKIHLQQQIKVGLLKFLFLYIFLFPILYNPFRYNWEMEAYLKSGISKEQAEKILKKWNYGFLLLNFLIPHSGL